MSDISSWSTSAASNNDSPPDGSPEGMAPSDVNNSMREIMAAVRRYYDDVGSVNSSGGSGGDFTLAASQTISAYAAGQWFVFTANHAPTISITDYTSSTYKWTASGSGTNEYYLELSGGGDPSVTEPSNLILDENTVLTGGTVGSLSDHEWDYGDNDTLGFSTIYFRDDSGDPDSTGITLKSGIPTLDVDSVGAKVIKKRHDDDLATGDILANQIVVVYYQATDDLFEMTNPSLGDFDSSGDLDVSGGKILMDADGNTTISGASDEIGFDIAGQTTLTLSDVDGKITFANLAIDIETDVTFIGPSNSIDLNGHELFLDSDKNTSLHADTNDQIDIRIGGSDDFSFKANTLEVKSGSNVDMNGQELILDANADTSITSDTDDRVDFKIGGNDEAQIDSLGLVGTLRSQTSVININDDAADSIAFGGAVRGIAVIAGNDGARGAAVVYFVAAGSPNCAILSSHLTGGGSVAATTGVLGGTTGTDTNITISAHTDNKLYIENRTGGAAAYQVTFLSLNGTGLSSL